MLAGIAAPGFAVIGDSSQCERTFGAKATPIAHAIQATVAWYRAHPQRKP